MVSRAFVAIGEARGRVRQVHHAAGDLKENPAAAEDELYNSMLTSQADADSLDYASRRSL